MSLSLPDDQALFSELSMKKEVNVSLLLAMDRDSLIGFITKGIISARPGFKHLEQYAPKRLT